MTDRKIGVAAWKIGQWRRRKIQGRRAASQSIVGYAPKADVVHVAFGDLSGDEKSGAGFEPEPYKWQPIALPPPAHSPNKAVTKGPSRFFKGFMANSKKPAPLPLDMTPPPAYSAQHSPPLITVQVSDEKNTAVATPANLKLQMLKTGPASPLPSPIRTASIGPDSPLFKSLASAPKLSAKPTLPKDRALPRLMVVACTFVPSLPDELQIRIGEPLRMLEEYEDEWCLVQRVGKLDADRGVIPRFCLQEVPAQQAAPPKRSSLVPSGLRP